jgi:branched-chain amino acid transport system substrate-binding protein
MTLFTRKSSRTGRWLAVTGVAVALTATACGDNNRRTDDSADGGSQGVTQTEIKIGGSFPFSGPFAVFGNTSKAIEAYFTCINEDGGVNGRQIVYSAADDAYDPGRLAANARKAVEQDQVAAFMSFGGTNVAIQPYMNEQEVPHIVLAGNTEFSRVDEFPYTHAWWPDLTWEAEYTTQFVMDNPDRFPSPEIGLISLNNTLADSHIQGTVNALGDQAATVFPEENRLRVEAALADWTSQLNQLRAAGVNVLYMNPGNAGQVNALKYIDQIGWDVKVVIYSNSASFKAVLEPVGLEAAKGIYTPAWLKDPADPQWEDDEGMKRYLEVIESCGTEVDAEQSLTANGYAAAQAVVQVLESLGEDEITGEAINEAWMSVEGEEGDVLMPGSTLTAGDSGRLIHYYQMLQFNGTTFEPVAPIADVREMGIAD